MAQGAAGGHSKDWGYKGWADRPSSFWRIHRIGTDALPHAHCVQSGSGAITLSPCPSWSIGIGALPLASPLAVEAHPQQWPALGSAAVFKPTLPSLLNFRTAVM